MFYATCLIVMFILSQTTINFSDFPVKTRVASIMIYVVQVQRFFNQVYTSCFQFTYICTDEGIV